jgi:LysR family glycine cleavage system transcriptional activator
MSDPLAGAPLASIRVFEAAARLGSFTRAAEELGMTQAAVSWQVKALERRLDQPLFRRLPREVVLTPAGERLARAAGEAMTALRAAFADLADTGAGVLSITTLQTFANQWLAPRLGAFQLAHPAIAVRLDTSARVVDLLHEDADVAVRSSRQADWPGMEAVFLLPSAQTVLMTPKALAALGPSPGPAALLGAPRVGSDAEWNAFFAAAGVAAPPAGGNVPRLAADNQIIEMAAGMARDEPAFGSPVMFAREIAEGRLAQPFDTYIGVGGGYWLVYPRDRRRARKIAAFREWLLDQVQADAAAQRLAAALSGPADRGSPTTAPA